MTISIIHPDRCEHDNLDKQGSDRSVGFEGYVRCEDCGADLTDNSDFNGENDEWDDGDRAYDSWKDDMICGIYDRD